MLAVIYTEWVEVSSKLINIEKKDIFFNGMDTMYFFIQFSIPWIMKWSIKINNILIGSHAYKELFVSIKQITRKVQMKKASISRSEIIFSYMKEVKRDLMKILDVEISENIFMAFVGHTTEEHEACLRGESQSAYSIEEIDMDNFESFLL